MISQEKFDELVARVSALETKTVSASKAKASPKPAEKMPSVPVEGQPKAEDYRLTSPIDDELCMARKLVTEDKRWSPAVYHEAQCQKKPTKDGLCTTCHSCYEKETDLNAYKKWNGRIGEDLLEHVHMLDSAWGAKKPVWKGGEAPAASPPKEPKAAKEEKPKAAKAAKEEKAEKPKAEKPKEEKPKEEKAEKPKAAKEEKAEKPKAEKKVKEKEKEKVTVPAAVVVAVPPADGDGVPMMINNEYRFVKNGNVYEFDELNHTPGDYIGRLIGTTDEPEIDGDAEEVLESDSE